MNLDVVLLILQVLMAIAIIGLVLLQKGKGASEGATFGGGGGAGSVFGASGSSNFLSKSTAILATCFFLNSLALAYLAGNREAPGSVIDTIEVTTDGGAQADSFNGMFGGGVPLPEDMPIESDVPAPADAAPENDVPRAAE